MSEFKLETYILLLRKWAWLVVLAAVIIGATAYGVLSSRQPTYKASALVSIGGYLRTPNPNLNDLRLAMELADTYAQIAVTSAVLQGTVDVLDLSIGRGQLRQHVSTDIIRNTSLLEIGVTYPDPVMAADIANTLAEQLLINSPSSLSPELRSQVSLSKAQIEILESQLQAQLDELDEIDDRIDEVQADGDDDTASRLVVQRNYVKDQINQTTATIAQFSDNITRIEQTANSLSIVEPASIPRSPSGMNPRLLAAAAAVSGAMMVAGAVVLREYLDTTVKSPDQIGEILELPVEGRLLRIRHDRKNPYRLINHLDPEDAVVERYRMLRTNLLYGPADRQHHLLLVTSAQVGEGKSNVAANLALSMAMGGMQTILVDADLRRPIAHKMFNLDNGRGLTNLLEINPDDLSAEERQEMLEEIIQQTQMPGLSVLPRGWFKKSLTHLLESDTLQKWMAHLLKQVDYIIVNTPPVSMTSDTSVMAANLDAAAVLMVVAHRQTQPAAARQAIQQIERVGGRIEGLVVNRISEQEDRYTQYSG